MIIFKGFQGLENFYIKFKDFPDFSRICMNTVIIIFPATKPAFSPVPMTNDKTFTCSRTSVQISPTCPFFVLFISLIFCYNFT